MHNIGTDSRRSVHYSELNGKKVIVVTEKKDDMSIIPEYQFKDFASVIPDDSLRNEFFVEIPEFVKKLKTTDLKGRGIYLHLMDGAKAKISIDDSHNCESIKFDPLFLKEFSGRDVYIRTQKDSPERHIVSIHCKMHESENEVQYMFMPTRK